MSPVPGLNNTFKTFLPTSILKSGQYWINSLTMLNVTYWPWAENMSDINENEYECAFLELVIESQPGHEFGKLLSVEISGVLLCLQFVFLLHFIFTQVTSVTTSDPVLPVQFRNHSQRSPSAGCVHTICMTEPTPIV